MSGQYSRTRSEGAPGACPWGGDFGPSPQGTTTAGALILSTLSLKPLYDGRRSRKRITIRVLATFRQSRVQGELSVDRDGRPGGRAQKRSVK
jgi:hypothetical protein